MKIDLAVIGPASKKLGAAFQKVSSLETIDVEHKIFPDGESYLRLNTDVEGKRVVVIQSTYPPQDTHLLQLFLLIDLLKELGAEKIFAVVPYLAYARQDSRFRSGEAVSVRIVLKLLKTLNINGLLTCNLHKAHTLHTFKGPSLNLSAIPLLSKYFSQLDLVRPLLIAPDKGALSLVKEAGGVDQTEYTYFEKSRSTITGAIDTAHKDVNVKGRDALIIDDIISTGSTIANVAKIVKKQGANKIVVGCVHAILARNAVDHLKSAGVDLIVGTDSVENDASKVTIAPLILEGLRRIT